MSGNTQTITIEHEELRSIKELLQEREARDKNIVLKGADILTVKGFTQVPNYVLESSKLSPGAKLTYAMLLKYAWQNEYCFPGQQRLADDMGAGERSVIRYIQELEAQAFIKIKRRGQGKVNVYELNLTSRRRTAR